MEILTRRITRQDLVEQYTTCYPTVTKAVVDVGRRIIAVDAEWHADLELMLLEDGSLQEDLWGVNLMLNEPADLFIVYESFINIRPSQQNFSMVLTDPQTRLQVKSVVDEFVDYGQVSGVREPSVLYGVESPPVAARAGLAATVYPCYKQHKKLTMAGWRAFAPWKRVLMTANELGRAGQLIKGGSTDGPRECYERALELLHITTEAARIESASPELIAGLIRLSERVARLYSERLLDAQENQRLTDELIALDPQAYRMTHQGPAPAKTTA